MARAPFANTFSWSHSRGELFDECLRKYYLSYYGAWGGWETGTPPRTRERYIQKNLTTRRMWIGSVVHDLAEKAIQALRAGYPLDPDREIPATLAAGRAAIARSEAGDYRKNPKRFPGFEEHFYGIEVSPETWAETIARIEETARRLFASRVYRRIGEVGEAGEGGQGKILSVEDLETFDFEGIPVWVKLDVVLKGKTEGSVVIVDWKTGKGHDKETIRTQLGIYALYGTQKWKIPPEEITAMHVDLHADADETHPVDEASLAAAAERIRTSAGAMRARLADVASNAAREEDFPKTEDLSLCARCIFRRDCGRE